MIALKEYEIYLKVKKFIETIDCDESDIIPRLINRVGIIHAYVPLVLVITWFVGLLRINCPRKI